ncbi:hypothetical protein [Vibrio mediterranei]|uniref:hypothetical protein n=1 Tax=Vibrio mediterranei TaxID=689 RepID=UPI0022851CEE|nr:hypothetical protein [Vibrio mediterranei]MCY9855431.1 hypothetical protein [Vibrio mediterranei]
MKLASLESDIDTRFQEARKLSYQDGCMVISLLDAFYVARQEGKVRNKLDLDLRFMLVTTQLVNGISSTTMVPERFKAPVSAALKLFQTYIGAVVLEDVVCLRRFEMRLLAFRRACDKPGSSVNDGNIKLVRGLLDSFLELTEGMDLTSLKKRIYG